MKKQILSSLFLSTTLLFAEGFMTSGTVVSDNNIMLSTKAMGFVTEINVKEGDTVSKGQTLIKIDDSSLKLKIDQVKNMKEMYLADFINLERNLKRYKRLYSKDMVSKAEVENLETGYVKLKKMIDLYDSQIAEIKDMKKYFSVKSPINGNIAQKNIKLGEMYMPGMPALIITDLNNLVVEVDVAESDIGLFGKNTIIKITNPSSNLISFGKVDRISPTLNPMTHTYKVKIRVEQNGNLNPGMYVNLEIKDAR